MIKLVKQTYREAKEANLVEGLELIGLVTAASDDVPFSISAINEINKGLIKNAECVEAEYIFGVEYKAMAGSYDGGTIGYGDAFKPEE